LHQYQQNEQLPLILTELNEHKITTTYDVGNPGPGLGQGQKCIGVKSVNGIPTPTNDRNPAQIRFHSQRPHTITKMNDSLYIYDFQVAQVPLLLNM